MNEMNENQNNAIAVFAKKIIYRQFGDKIEFYCPVGTKLKKISFCFAYFLLSKS